MHKYFIYYIEKSWVRRKLPKDELYVTDRRDRRDWARAIIDYRIRVLMYDVIRLPNIGIFEQKYIDSIDAMELAGISKSHTNMALMETLVVEQHNVDALYSHNFTVGSRFRSFEGAYIALLRLNNGVSKEFFGKTDWEMRDTFKSGVYFCGGINFNPEHKTPYSLAVSNVPTKVKTTLPVQEEKDAPPKAMRCCWVATPFELCVETGEVFTY